MRVVSCISVVAAVAVAPVAAGCTVADFDLAGMPCPCVEASYRCVDGTCVRGDGGIGSAGAGAGGGGAGGGAGSGVPSSDGCTGPIEVAGTIASDLVEVKVAGCWSLLFTEASRWQPTGWFDLKSNPDLDLAPLPATADTALVFSPASISAGPWVGPEQVPAADVTATLEDFSPARVVLTTKLALDQTPSIAIPDLELWATYTIWASGRIGVRTQLRNVGSTTQQVPDLRYHETVVGADQAWSLDPMSDAGNIDAKGAAFRRKVGPEPRANLITLDRTGTDASWETEATTHSSWRLLYTDIDPGAEIVWDGELQVTPGGQTLASLADRVKDTQSPGAPVVTSGKDPAFDVAGAAYTLTASGSSVTFAPAPGLDRHRPAFVIQGWDSPTWRIRRGSETLAASGAPSTPRGAAFHDPGASRIDFTYLDVLGAGDLDEPFVLEVP